MRESKSVEDAVSIAKRGALMYFFGALLGAAGGFAVGYHLVPTSQIGYVEDRVENANTWVCVELNGLVVLSAYRSFKNAASLNSFPKGVYSICVSMKSEPDGRDLNITTALRSVGARFEERE